jgi:hypothetical protein
MAGKRNDRFRGDSHEKLPFLCLSLRDGMQPKPDFRDRWVAPLISGELCRSVPVLLRLDQ